MKNKISTDTLCWIGFSLYLVLALWWSPERIFNTDNSNYFFHLINFKKFHFPENRYGVWLSQVPLLTAIQLKLSFPVLVYIYSLSFPILYLLIAIICRYYLQVKEAGLAILLSMVCGVSFSFFHCVTETHQCIVYAIGFYAAVVSQRSISWIIRIPLSIFFIIQSLLCHPNAAFILLGLVLVMFINKQITWKFVTGIAILIALFIGYKLTSATGYDQQQYNNLWQFFDTITILHRSYYFYFLSVHSIDTYLSFLLILVSTAIYCTRQKMLLQFLAIAFFSICFTIITILTFYQGDADSMMEKSLMPALLPFFVFISRHVFYNEKVVFIRGMLLLVIMLCSFVAIGKASKIHSNRLALLESILEKNKYYPKLYIEQDSVKNTPLFTYQWATTIDAIWISKMNGKQASTLYLKHADEGEQKYSCDTSILYVPWWPDFTYFYMNQDYVEFPEIAYKNAELPEKKLAD
ncbi:MAG: hypothetical protein IPO27_10640 [Bacteroidetes bacterium]|nr:hypothetical protein [Bacteroidota bacterium]